MTTFVITADTESLLTAPHNELNTMMFFQIKLKPLRNSQKHNSIANVCRSSTDKFHEVYSFGTNQDYDCERLSLLL